MWGTGSETGIPKICDQGVESSENILVELFEGRREDLDIKSP